MPSKPPSVSLVLPVCNDAEKLPGRVATAMTTLYATFGDDFEIIIAINGKSKSDREKLLQAIPPSPRIRATVWEGPPGKGNAVRAGFQASQGQWIFFTDSDLPYDLTAIHLAFEKLNAGADFVFGSRRHPDSRVRVSSTLIEFLQHRRTVSKIFVRIIRMLLWINHADIQAGFKAMNRSFAEGFFPRMRETGYYYESECFLFCKRNGYQISEIPLTIVIEDDSTTVSLPKEFLKAMFSTLKTRLRYELGYYTKKFKEEPALLPHVANPHATQD